MWWVADKILHLRLIRAWHESAQNHLHLPAKVGNTYYIHSALIVQMRNSTAKVALPP